MADIWIANASPVIVLAKAGYLRLLNDLPRHLLLPDTVAAEILAGPASDPARKALEGGWALPAVSAAIPSELLEWGSRSGRDGGTGARARAAVQ